MAPKKKPFTYCEGAPSWNPTTYIADAPLHARVEALLANDDFASAIAASFSLPPPNRDKYTYHAIVSVTLPEVQHAISLGRQNGLHAWYFAPTPTPTPPPNDNDATTTTPQPQKQTLTSLAPPPRPDTEAYLALFSPSTSTASALKTLHSNARKSSLRLSTALHLLSKRYLHPSLPSLTIPKQSKKSPSPPTNPYLQFLIWSIKALEWCGPCPASTLAGLRSHPVLPILMHHFGCACPSHEALSILRVVAAGRPVFDIGSGGGYWTYMLRAYGVDCVAVDSAQSEWRVNWVDDTVISDGAAFLKRRKARNTGVAVDPDEPVLLLVYPIVGGSIAGGSEGGFTRAMLDAYSGDTLAVVGTQNRNGYTGFRGESMDEYMEREQASNGWVKVVQVALPSFPGKDEALFVFQRGARAPTSDRTEVGERDEGKSKDENKSSSGNGNKGAS
ncbi:uncharacterized protein GGS22DRAFT_121835 [Annulohypoxylon maeteangense]|uniref:uncharacterized protein n=1 Tax=Annulohypoxylon maeteangense TaxID=1927788 RepID=UPI002008E94D|nr:uncharacterized protein GGS22DRAFT_121835 [Annulohypoxylon maeteangense]KAI0885947.1 hypothetical protein GGS22DRAFT_121835 [Annulohypoxylon maeteangense]